MRIRRRNDRACVPSAVDLREEDTLVHAVPVCRGDGRHKGHAHGAGGAGGRGDGDAVGAAVRPVGLTDGVGWLTSSVGEVGRNVYLDTVFFREFRVLRVGTSDQDSAVVQKDRLGVVHSRDNRRAKDGHSLANGLGGVVEQCFEVGDFGETEAGDAFFGAVQDEERAVRKGYHVWHDTSRWLEEQKTIS